MIDAVIRVAVVFVIVLVVLLVVLIVVRIVRPGRKRTRLQLADMGTMIDRALRSYRENLVPLLALSLLLAPLGIGASYRFFSPLLLLGLLPPQGLFGFLNNVDVLLPLLVLVSSLGFANVLIGCCAARVVQLRAAGLPVTFGAVLRFGRWRAALGLAALLAIPSLVANYLGTIGALAGLLWAAAPAVLLFEPLGPWNAAGRCVKLTW